MMKLELSFLPDVGDKHTGKLAVAAPPTFYDRLKEIPGYAWSTRAKVTTVPRSWASVLALGSMAREYQIAMSPDADVLAWYKQQAQEWRDLQAMAADLGQELKKADGFSYYPHQIAGAYWLLGDTEMQGRALLDQTGAGKTGTIICAIQQGNLTAKGPVLVLCPESVMETGWLQGAAKFAPELRAVQVVGSAAKRKKILEQVRDGEFDIAIMGYSNLRTSTRLEAFPGQALRRCISCGGPRLTSGLKDEQGNPLPDIPAGHEVFLSEDENKAVCSEQGCDFKGTVFPTPEQAWEEGLAHTKETQGKPVKELTAAQCQAHHKELNDIPWSVIVADEAHRCLNARSQTTMALNGVGKYAPSMPRRWAATGTPVSTRVEQAWSILHFLDPRAWPTRTKWVDWYCDSGYNWAGFFEVTGLKAKRQEEFQATWKGATRRVLKEQVLDLPPKLRWGSLEERLTMSGEQLRVYNEMKEEMLALVDEGAITAQNVMVQASRLSMLASGTGYPVDDAGTLGLRLPSVKVDALLSMWRDKEWDGEQIAILFSSRRALKMAEQAMYEADMIRPETVALIHGEIPQARRTMDINDFQAGKRNIAMLTYAAGGTGITLTAASTVIMFERNWSPILNAQGEDRFHRIGSERHAAITYRDLVVGNSNEVAQLDRMEQNAETLESIVHDRDKLRAIFGG